MTDVTDVRIEEEAIQSELAGGVLTIHLNRPKAANAIRPDDRNRLIDLFTDASIDHEVRVVVLRARGRQFCAGADVVKLADGHAKNVKRTTGPMKTIMGGAQRLVASVLDCSKPVVTAVQGAAAGIGAHLAYASDLVVATDNAYFAESFVKRGLSWTVAAPTCCRVESVCRRPKRWRSSAKSSRLPKHSISVWSTRLCWRKTSTQPSTTTFTDWRAPPPARSA